MANDMILSALIYGSCVSRDLARVDSSRFVASHYTARQSWISAYAEPQAAPSLKIQSAFQKRMVEDDFRSSARSVLISTRPRTHDVILLDLIDERLGVLPYEGSWITMSNELKNSGALQKSVEDQIVDFGSDEHFELWRVAAARVREDLAPYLLKTFVIAASFAAHTNEGRLLENFRGETAELWNAKYTRYYDELGRLGFQIVQHSQDIVVASEVHKWGATPFHYVDDAYLQFGNQILSNLGVQANVHER